jgi:CheY-like chemotaxis protein
VVARQADNGAAERAEIVRMRAELDAERQQVQDMIANVSHELRTPLTAIIGYSDLLLNGSEGALSDEQRADVATIDRSARHLLELIDDLASASIRPEAARTESVPLILIVDDTTETRALMRRLLERDGLRVIEARTGEAALEQIASFRPDLVILDIRLPGMSGLDVARAVRANPDPAIQRTVLLACSASIQPDIEADVRAAGCDDFEPKPFDAARFASRVRGLLSRGRPA